VPNFIILNLLDFIEYGFVGKLTKQENVTSRLTIAANGMHGSGIAGTE
jgi:hypothetical protein